MASRAEAVRRGVRAIGQDRVKPGPVRIGATRRLTPTRAGFRALDAFLLSVQRGSRKGSRELYSYDLQIRHRGPNGKLVDLAPFTGNVFPLPSEVRSRRRKGETAAATYRRLVETAIKSAIFRQADENRNIFGNTNEVIARLERAAKRRGRKKPDAQRVREAFRAFRSKRSLTFKIAINRVIPGGR